MAINTKSTVAIATAFLVCLAIMHFFAYTLSHGEPGAGFWLDPKLAILFISYYLTWIAVLVAIFYLMNKYLPVYGTRFLILLFFASSFLWIPCATLIDGTFTDIVYQRQSRGIVEIIANSPPLSYYTKFLTYSFLYGGMAVLVYYRLYQSARVHMLEREKESAEAKFAITQQRLTSLQSQLTPHFLFNCLNMLSGLARMGQRDELVFAIARLGDMLRFVSEASRHSTIFLSDEVEFVNNYVELQQVRFADKYFFSLSISGDISGVECPPFCLHTLVENAYTHTAPTSDKSTQITAQIDVDERSVELQVKNSNPSQQKSPKLGIGLANLKDRLTLLYGKQYELSALAEENFYTATMRIPQ